MRELGISQIVRGNGGTLKIPEKIVKLSVLKLYPKTNLNESLGKVWGPGILIENHWCNGKKNRLTLTLEPICSWFCH